MTGDVCNYFIERSVDFAHRSHIHHADELLAAVSMFFRSERGYEVQSNLQSLGAWHVLRVAMS